MNFISQRVEALIGIAGQTDITYRESTGSSYDPSTGANVSTYSDHVVTGFVRKYSPKELTGGLVQQIDREVKIAKDFVTFIIKENDLVVINGKTFTVVTSEQRNAKDDYAMYIIQVRGNDD